jgi:hypothetical protein
MIAIAGIVVVGVTTLVLVYFYQRGLKVQAREEAEKEFGNARENDQ